MPLSQTDDRSPGKPQLYAILFAVLLLGVPVAGVALRASHNMHEPEARAAALRQAPAAVDLGTLEARVHAAPTAANQLNLSLGYINTNAPGQAVPILMLLVSEDRNNALAWNNLCVAYNLQKDYKRGIEACTEALRVDPGFQLAANNLKWGMDEEEKQSGTAAPFRRPAPLSEQDIALYMDQGLRQLNGGDYDAATALWQRILAADPANAIAANNIGTAFMFKKEPGAALGWFQRAIQINPAFQLAKNNLAWARQEQIKAGK